MIKSLKPGQWLLIISFISFWAVLGYVREQSVFVMIPEKGIHLVARNAFHAQPETTFIPGNMDVAVGSGRWVSTIIFTAVYFITNSLFLAFWFRRTRITGMCFLLYVLASVMLVPALMLAGGNHEGWVIYRMGLLDFMQSPFPALLALILDYSMKAGGSLTEVRE